MATFSKPAPMNSRCTATTFLATPSCFLCCMVKIKVLSPYPSCLVESSISPLPMRRMQTNFFLIRSEKKINKEAGSKLVNSNFELSGEELQSVMMLPLCDGNLIPLIEQLKYRGWQRSKLTRSMITLKPWPIFFFGITSSMEISGQEIFTILSTKRTF